MSELTEKHSGKYLYYILNKSLEKYNIKEAIIRLVISLIILIKIKTLTNIL